MKKTFLIIFLFVFNISNVFSDSSYFIDFNQILNKSKAGISAQENLKKKFENESKKFKKQEVELKKKGFNGFELIQKYDWKHQSIKMKKVYEWVLSNIKKPEFVFKASDKSK